MKKAIAFVLLLLTISCSSPKSTPSNQYKVGVDSTFFPCELGQQKTNVYAFMRELLTTIGEKNGVELQVVGLSWDDLFSELALNKVDGVVSAAPMTIMNTNKYEFSNALLRTGPVLVVPVKSDALGLESLKNMVVSIPRGNQEIEIIADFPETEFIFYDKYASTMELVALGNLQGTLIPIIPAHQYVHNLFHNSLKIISNPLTTEGLRVVTPLQKGRSEEKARRPVQDNNIGYRRSKMTKIINDGLSEMRESGEYNKLLEKWNLSQ